MDALNPGVVDVFLAGVSEIQGSRSGPIGRVLDLQNGVVTHYNPGQSIPSRIKVQQRNGFKSLTINGHSATTGATSNPSWANPELLSALGSQILSIANAIPRVYDGTDWTHYAEERVVSNQLSESIFHTSQRTIGVPTHAYINGVTCSVWNEQPSQETTTQILYIGFRGDDGAWIRTPQVLYDPFSEGDFLIPFAKVKADDSGLYFWVVHQSYNAANKFSIKLFNLNGEQIDSVEIAKIQDVYSARAFWDIAKIDGGGLLLAQPLHTVASATDGVSFATFTQSSGVVSVLTADNPDIHCRGPLAFITNDLDNHRHYLATLGLGEEPSGKLWGYELSPPSPNPFSHEYDFEIQPAVDTTVDSLVGFVTAHPDISNPTNIPDMTVSFTSFQDLAASSGPPFDPQYRYSEVWTCDIFDVVTFERQNDYTCQVSRAFLHDDEYYTINYYQSGSGNAISSTQLEVDFTPGDYMIGAKLQPVEVRNGGGTVGSTVTLSGAGAPFNNIYTSSEQASFAITGADTVEFVNVSVNGFPSRTMLKWTFANMSIDMSCIGARLHIGPGSSIPGADGSWDVLWANTTPDNWVYTSISSTNGGTVSAGTFAAAGNAEVVSMTIYRLPTLGTFYDNVTKDDLVPGTAVVTGNGTSANNGTKTIARTCVGWTQDFDQFGLGPGFWIVTGSESMSNDGFSAALSPPTPNQWVFPGNFFDESLLIGPHNLIVEDDAFVVVAQQFNAGIVPTETPASNNSTPAYTITDVPGDAGVLVTDGTAIVAEVFKSPLLPKITFQVPDDVTPYTFFLQAIDPDYTYLGATLIVTSDTVQTDNNGVYQIVGFDTTGHIIYCVPIDGKKSQRSQMFVADDQGITIVFRTNVQPEFQSCWLMVPLTGTKPVVGRFEYQLAYADWRFEGTMTPNLFPGDVTDPVIGPDGWLFVLPYRAVSFTVGQSVAVNSGQVVNASIPVNQSTIGFKQFQLSESTGNATVSSDQLMLPGPMCGQFTTSGFTENGINFGFEAPYLISQQVSSNSAALRIGGSYQVVLVGEIQEENGDRTFSIVSPPLNFTLTGDNNSATYGIRPLQPFDSNGNPINKHFGVTNRRLVGISVYRTSYQNDTPTTDHHKVTPVLNVNGLAPISDTNDSGFAFTSEFVTSYLDENLDASIIQNEILYTDKGFLPRFPAPAQRNGDFWKQRTWVIGYDGAIWMSGEKREGDSTWFFPLWRIVLPTTDKAVACAEMDDYLIIGCEKSMWYIPSGNLPDSTGREGLLPTPVQLPFSNGCTGHMITLREGVAYSSTDGGIWMVTRGLTNFWLSQPKQDSIGTIPITGMTIDKRQRLVISIGTGHLFAYDQTVKTWYTWPIPASDVHFVTTADGEVSFQEDNRVWTYDPSIYYDDFDGSKVGIALDLTLSSFQFGNVRGLKSCWAMQIVGDYKGEHHINAVLSYPDDDPDNPTVFPDPDDGPYTPDPSLPYLLEINPMIEQASSFGLRIFTDFAGITNPGNSCEIELISCEVGFDSSVGVNKFPDSRRIPGR